MLDHIHNFCLAYSYTAGQLLSVLYAHEPELWSSGFSTYLHSQIGKTVKLVGRKMIKVLAWPTNNKEQFCGQTKARNFKCEHFTKFCAGLHEIFGFHWFNLSSFVICFNVVEFILFWRNIKIRDLC